MLQSCIWKAAYACQLPSDEQNGAEVSNQVGTEEKHTHGGYKSCTNVPMFGTVLSKKLMETADLMMGFSSGLPGKFASMV